ncbi:MAG: hypothetical protein K8J08_03860 [Thermoanaerobaculia bacterium]|nr:hypothetical protein [Thermoanaerobaculia bacterium]
MQRVFAAVAVALILASVHPAVACGQSGSAPPNPMVHAEGTHLVDGDGQPLQLRGVILEGWLMWNGTLWGAGLNSETKLAERIEELVGPQEAKRFRTARDL